MYNIDSDLKFLFDCSNDQIKLLCDTLTHDLKDGKPRYTETLSNSPAYIAYYPHEMSKIVPAIINEYSLFGGNTIVNMFRGSGVSYKEILCDVCKYFKIKCNKADSVELMELALLQIVAKEMVDNIKKQSNSDDSTTELINNLEKFCKGELSDYKSFPSMISCILLSFAPRLTGKYLVRAVGGKVIWSIPLGPIAWISYAWMISDIAAPAFRVTIPATIIIACLRCIYNNKAMEEFDITD